LGRIIVDFHDTAAVGEAAERAARVFGVAYIGVGRRIHPDLEEIAATALDLVATESFESFRVRARRTYSTLDRSSLDINIDVGQRIKDATGARVDLTGADLTVHIELFGRAGIVYTQKTKGPGGLPVGVSGRILGLLSGGIDSPVAAWRMMRRGAEVELVHFHGQPYSDPSSARQAEDIAVALTRYQLRSVLHLVPLGDAQREIVAVAPSSLRVLLYRRAMLRIATALALQRDAQALVTGDALGQVASQTIENIATVDAAISSVQIFRPLMGMDKLEIVEGAQSIGTFDLSTRSYQDCCVLFQPRAPATRATPEAAAEAERGLDLEAMTGKALAGIETRLFELPEPQRPPPRAT
jgi:thiamine biosynthesis protein ThiI